MNCSKLSVKLRVPQRYLITFICVLGTIIASMMKYAVGIAITEMVVPTASSSSFDNPDPEACPYFIKLLNQTTRDAVLQTVEVGRFAWSEKTQGMIFGALYWTYVPLQMPSGLLVERVGPRYLLAAGMLLSSVSYLVTPLAIAAFDSAGFLLVRVLSGAGLATLYPCLNLLLAKWVPPSEKSRLGSLVYAGENIGFILSMALSGFILGQSQGQWPLMFYVYGGAGIVWTLVWLIFGYDDPSSSPFITENERIYLGECMPFNHGKKLPPTPWVGMLTSLPLWGTLIAQIGHDWGIISIVTELPKYMKDVLHFEIQDNGLLTAIPYAAMTVVAVVSGWVSDWLLHNDYMSITSVRKLFTTIAAVGPSIGLVGAMASGCDSTMVVAMFTLGMALMGFYYPSLSVNTLDLSPNYSGTLMGFMALGGLGGIFSPYVAGLLAPDRQFAHGMAMQVCALRCAINMLVESKEELKR
ncbi:putative inorganic phosphate cotransporter [Macrosteles quadrilineatus]|uniref:putative inorganic phosphate cotransporter n=1 Tax=Macrosteles quadrilineatus TaxID=74068 RepID=UPI0023E2FDFB|nr:putative inorganic phosphate cotransporter [Macrosteles quadrilineatus]